MKAVNLEKLLPGDVPQGEQILWHGRPRWISLARRAYRGDFIAAYFIALTIWNACSAPAGPGLHAAALVSAKSLGLGAAALALIALLSFLAARTTLYVVTSRRLVVKIGVALPLFINIPFRLIIAADARLYGDGTGDIPVRLMPEERISYLVLWPHARPFHFANPQPALRCVANAADVADTLGRALRQAAGQPDEATQRAATGTTEPLAGSLALAKRAAA